MPQHIAHDPHMVDWRLGELERNVDAIQSWTPSANQNPKQPWPDGLSISYLWLVFYLVVAVGVATGLLKGELAAQLLGLRG